MKTSTKTVVSRLKDDKKYKKLEHSFNTLSIFSLPKDELITEIKTAHEVREIRRLSTEDPDFIDKLIKANVNDQSTRSRLAEIMVRCVQVTARLDNATDNLKKYFLVEYSDLLRQFRTKEERMNVLNIVLQKYNKFIDDVKIISKMCEIVVSDIDKGAYSLQRNIAILEIHKKRENRI